MKNKVNAKWYNQYLNELKQAIVQEKITLRQQFYRYRDAKDGKKQDFDVDNNISTEKLFEYLDSAVHCLGKNEVMLKELVAKYEPDTTIKVDWKAIETEVKNWCAKNKGILSDDDCEYLDFIGSFFCDPKFAIPDSEKNNDRFYGLMNKYFVSIFDSDY